MREINIWWFRHHHGVVATPFVAMSWHPNGHRRKQCPI